MTILKQLLQDRSSLIEEINDERNLRRKTRDLALVSLALFFIFGSLLGISNSWQQALSSGIKLPLLFLLTLVVCIPTFFIFNSILGSRQTLLQTVAKFLCATTFLGLILFGFAPVTLFFHLTSDHYQFYKLLNVLFFAISGMCGVNFLFSVYMGEGSDHAQGKGSRFPLMVLWMVLYGFVGSQLSWSLRPFFGAPDLPFQIVREMSGNFFTDVVRAIHGIY